MALMDRVIGVTGRWLAKADSEATPLRPLAWARKTTGYLAVNRLIGMAIPFATRNGFSVEEVRPGYVRARIRLKGNKNHFGSLYAGAYFLVAEIPGGVLSLFDLGPAYTPILKEMTLQFLKPADSDVTVEFNMDSKTIDAIKTEADYTGRAAFSLEGQLYDDTGELVAISIAHYRVRRKGFESDKAGGATLS
ncbi:MAG: YiiD C-terminal domain-containing protein [Oleiphilaceae bacterium]|nr:YiiD C-terminal domain-containing protein [Oleiphilaceae bacterium]